MKLLACCLTILFSALSLRAQDIDRADALIAAIDYVMDTETGIHGNRFILDTVRTAHDDERRVELIREIATRIDARQGRIEDHCFRIPASEPAALESFEVRAVSAVIAANFVDLQSDQATVRVTVWSGRGMHPGGSSTLLLSRKEGKWWVEEHLTSANAGCIPSR